MSAEFQNLFDMSQMEELTDHLDGRPLLNIGWIVEPTILETGKLFEPT